MRKADIQLIKMLTEYKAEKMNKHDAVFYKEDLESAVRILTK